MLGIVSLMADNSDYVRTDITKTVRVMADLSSSSSFP